MSGRTDLGVILLGGPPMTEPQQAEADDLIEHTACSTLPGGRQNWFSTFFCRASGSRGRRERRGAHHP
jgi:hypothetical protein